MPRQLRSHAAEDGIDLEIAWFDAHQWDVVGIQQHRAMPRKQEYTFGGPVADVRFGSKADICSAKRHVRFTAKSGINERAMKWPSQRAAGRMHYH